MIQTVKAMDLTMQQVYYLPVPGHRAVGPPGLLARCRCAARSRLAGERVAAYGLVLTAFNRAGRLLAPAELARAGRPRQLVHQRRLYHLARPYPGHCKFELARQSV